MASQYQEGRSAGAARYARLAQSSAYNQLTDRDRQTLQTQAIEALNMGSPEMRQFQEHILAQPGGYQMYQVQWNDGARGYMSSGGSHITDGTISIYNTDNKSYHKGRSQSSSYQRMPVVTTERFNDRVAHITDPLPIIVGNETDDSDILNMVTLQDYLNDHVKYASGDGLGELYHDDEEIIFSAQAGLLPANCEFNATVYPYGQKYLAIVSTSQGTHHQIVEGHQTYHLHHNVAGSLRRLKASSVLDTRRRQREEGKDDVPDDDAPLTPEEASQQFVLFVLVPLRDLEEEARLERERAEQQAMYAAGAAPVYRSMGDFVFADGSEEEGGMDMFGGSDGHLETRLDPNAALVQGMVPTQISIGAEEVGQALPIPGQAGKYTRNFDAQIRVTMMIYKSVLNPQNLTEADAQTITQALESHLGQDTGSLVTDQVYRKAHAPTVEKVWVGAGY